MISVVTPICNEEGNILELHRRCSSVFQECGETVELIFVNDGSTDRSLPILKSLAAGDPQVKVVSFSRNFGHQIAVTAGLDYARGDAVVVIDADLQDPPELIAEMLEKWKEGYQVVYAQRQERKGETFFKKKTAYLFYRLMRFMTATDVPADTGDFRLMDREVVEVVKKMRERNRFLRGMVSWAGFKQTGLPFERQKRLSGNTKYPLTKMIRFAINGIVSFSDKPLRIASYLGLISSGIGLLMIFYGIYSKLFMPETTVSGWASVFIAVLFLGGVQLFTIGIIGEYISRIYEETKARPLYIVDEKINC